MSVNTQFLLVSKVLIKKGNGEDREGEICYQISFIRREVHAGIIHGPIKNYLTLTPRLANPFRFNSWARQQAYDNKRVESKRVSTPKVLSSV
jgi:hypothetical protein